MATQSWSLLLGFGVTAYFEFTGATLDDVIDNVNFQNQWLGSYWHVVNQSLQIWVNRLYRY